MERDLVKDKTLCNAFGETFTEENFSPYLRILKSRSYFVAAKVNQKLNKGNIFYRIISILSISKKVILSDQNDLKTINKVNIDIKFQGSP